MSACILALVIRHANRMRRIMSICYLSGSTIFSHIISQTVRFWGEKNTECVLIFSTTFLVLITIMHTSPRKVPIVLVII
jgi:hypothetical protein